MASGTRTGLPVRHRPARDMPAAAGPAGPLGEQCGTGATGDTGPAGSARPQGPKGDVGDTAPMGDRVRPARRNRPPVRRAHARAQRRADDLQRRDQRGDGEPPRWSVATGGRYVITPGSGRPCRCLTAPTAAPAGPCRWAIPRQARRPRYAPSLADVPRREKARAAGGTVEEAASRSARHGRRAQRGSGSPLAGAPRLSCARCRGCQPRCGGAVAPDRREASVREAPSDDLAKLRPLKGMSKEPWALGRAVQALQADDDATSGVSRPWGPDATGPGHTTTPGGRQNRGAPDPP
jgi:hypothetical protein